MARVLIPPPEFKTFARRVLLDLRFPLLPVCPTDEPAAVETERWFRERLVGSVEKFLAEEKIPPAELTQPPTSVESDQVAYCPRCETPFVSATANCAECGGRALVLFAR